MLHRDPAGDHLIDITYIPGDEGSGEPGRFERIADFSWEEVYRAVDGEEPAERMISFSDSSAAISVLIGWLCHSGRDEPADIRTVAAKCEALLFWLDPNQSKYESLADIARVTGHTRAAISKQLLNLKDQLGSCVSVGKRSHTRATYRACQVEAIEKGTHASFKRRSKAN